MVTASKPAAPSKSQKLSQVDNRFNEMEKELGSKMHGYDEISLICQYGIF